MFHYIPRLLQPLNPIYCPENCLVVDDVPFKLPFAGDVPFISKDSINIPFASIIPVQAEYLPGKIPMNHQKVSLNHHYHKTPLNHHESLHSSHVFVMKKNTPKCPRLKKALIVAFLLGLPSDQLSDALRRAGVRLADDEGGGKLHG